jgi:branched-chain amino acid transport system ATP-binding protein
VTASATASPALPDQAPALELRRISGGYGKTAVLRDVSVAVRPGSIDALLGPNGAGKTTLLGMAAGLLPITDGQVLLGGQEVTERSPSQRARSGLCLIPEGRGIFPSLTVRENLVLQVPPWEKSTPYEVALDIFPVLRDRLGQTAGTLSGGQQQMLALSRCYLASPSIVLLDEVSMGLAPRIVDEIFGSLTRLASTGVALLLVEQYVNRALEMADTAHLLNRGIITYSGAASALDTETVMQNYLGSG